MTLNIVRKIPEIVISRNSFVDRVDNDVLGGVILAGVIFRRERCNHRIRSL